ncbi:hypothetical protein HM1_2805 [Heliomicrobium modesticaldum Ice1]|uniref:Uncharacterized protein n=1 Tax=Heliobacterium modesticaldum (strain ATCC 51547 / Ice1) TaxID=498761 RepID=B0TCE6_HELMI|nr:hypothetical protein [Heliomicrobium modesticaldum]ABZ85334.1 hypothetical protein HM1_2805 [Heliomicrobium modesticaldum Ice1]
MANQKKARPQNEPEKGSFLTMIPGFRSQTPWKMGAAGAFYLTIVLYILLLTGIIPNPPR